MDEPCLAVHREAGGGPCCGVRDDEFGHNFLGGSEKEGLVAPVMNLYCYLNQNQLANAKIPPRYRGLTA